MVVLFLLGFMMLLTYPSFRQFIGPPDAKRAVRGFVAALRYTQSQAATTKQRHRLNIEVKENTYWVSVEGEQAKFYREPSSLGQPVLLPGGVIFLDVDHPRWGRLRDKAAIEFSPTGWAEDCSIHLQRGGEEAFTVFVHSLGGKIEVAPGYVERNRG